MKALLAIVVAVLAVQARAFGAGLLPPSSWVAHYTYDPRSLSTAPDQSFGSRWLLKDHQINARNDETFVHGVRQILNPTGATEASRLVIDYDPSCQTLTYHWIRVYRAGVASSRFDPSKIQTEPKTNFAGVFFLGPIEAAVVAIDDLAPGDILDYAYTIEGSNPALAARVSARLALQYDEPVEKLIHRVLWPPPRKLYIQNHGATVQPQTAYKSNLVEFLWELRQVPGVRLEPQSPATYDPYPWVQLSEFPNWASVNRWALALFAPTNVPSAALERQAATWKHLPTEEEQTLAALQYVQSSIATTFPGGSDFDYQPDDPGAVISRRHGDSADKARLLAGLLRALKIPASPVLVNTRWKQTILDWHASPALFDRVLVRAAIGDTFYWLDPAAENQEGSLGARSWPDCGCGLVIRPGVETLSAIPTPPPPRTSVNESFKLHNSSDTTELRVVTIATGSDADYLRGVINSLSRGDLERDRRAVFEKVYPEIESAAPLVYSDDDSQDRVEMVEHYRIPNIWVHLPDEAFFHCHLVAADLKPLFQQPVLTTRTQPLAIAYPVRRTLRIEATLPPGAIPAKPENQTVESPAFTFRRTVHESDGRLIIEFDYHSLTDALPPEDVAAHAAQLAAAAKLLDYTDYAY